jgi:signal transduction histidine kinase
MAELVGGLAHELRNPLSTMMINLKLLAEHLQDRDADPEDARRRALLKVDGLRREAERLQRLFDEFLHLTGPYQLQRTEADVNDILTRLAEFFRPAAKAGRIDVQLALAGSPLTCVVDEARLRQAILNIVLNAQEAMPDGGILLLATEARDDHIVISISDTGVGIAEEDHERILRPFFSTRAEGTGLGLSITQRIIQEHDGTLSFKGTRGEGTTFTIRLPRAGTGPDADTAPR